MSMNNLTIDGEFRYILKWFVEWSELQRDDFIPVVVNYIMDKTDAPLDAVPMVNMNGLDTNEKPMSLFQCRVKLFNQWNKKWPHEFKEKLQQKLTEIDTDVGEKIKEALTITYNGGGKLANGFSGSVDDHECELYLEAAGKDQQQPNITQKKVEDQQQVASEVMALTNTVTIVDPMQAVLSNETSVDDIEPTDVQQQQVNSKESAKDNENVAHSDGINEDCTTRLNDGNYDAGDQTKEPVEQVLQIRNLQIKEDHEDVTASAEQTQQQAHNVASTVPVTVTVNPIVVVAAQTLNVNAEVPLVV